MKSWGLSVSEYKFFRAYGGDIRYSQVKKYTHFFRYLPKTMVEGTIRLADHLRYLDPEVVHIWQDGAVFECALAALIAGVPRIVLNVRSLPPIDRVERDKPQYHALYKMILRLSGTVLTANSHFAAKRYADWLDMDVRHIPVIHNGIDPPSPGGDFVSQTLHAEFASRDAGTGFTVGSVMRFDDNKRPYLWLDTAKAILDRVPAARFIIVGDGPLLEPAKKYASELGILERVLFTGHSKTIGFWLAKFDCFLLLSRFEGLPNVLIESQSSGVPVFTTHAGGAAETVLEGKTGFVFRDTDHPDAAEIALWILSKRADLASWEQMPEAAKAWAAAGFSVASMLDRTVRSFAGV